MDASERPDSAPAVAIPTPRLLIRELREADLVDLCAFEADPEVVRFLTHGPRTEAQTVAGLQASLDAARRRPRLYYDLALEERATGALIGCCGLERKVVRRTAPRRYEAGLWYTLARSYWGRGLATEACRGLVGFGFEALSLHRITVEADPRNAASLAVARRLGMREEGCLRRNYWSKGEWCDTALYALLAEEHGGNKEDDPREVPRIALGGGGFEPPTQGFSVPCSTS